MSLLRRSVEPMLPDRDYLPLAMPNAGVHVLQVLTRHRGVLRQFSDLTTVLHKRPADEGPRVNRNVLVVNADGTSTRTEKIHLGLAVVGAIVGALGGGHLGLTAAAEAAQSIRYSYTGVAKDDVDLGLLDQWLAEADLNGHSLAVSELVTAEQLYVTICVLRATGVAVTLLDSNDQAIGLDLPTIQEMVGGSVNVSASGSASTTLEMTGSTPITVAAKAAQLKADSERGFWVRHVPVQGGEIRDLSGRASYLSDPTGYLLL
jgi:hypothetical protein